MNRWVKVKGQWRLAQKINDNWMSSGTSYTDEDVIKHITKHLADTRDIVLDYFPQEMEIM